MLKKPPLVTQKLELVGKAMKEYQILKRELREVVEKLQLINHLKKILVELLHLKKIRKKALRKTSQTAQRILVAKLLLARK